MSNTISRRGALWIGIGGASLAALSAAPARASPAEGVFDLPGPFLVNADARLAQDLSG